MATDADVRRICRALPEIEEDSDTLGFGVRGKGFAWLWRERVAPKKPRVPRPDVLAIRTPDQAAKQSLLDADPDVYFTEPHYNGFPAVLVRLAAIEPDELAELLIDGWRAMAPKTLVREYDAASQ